MLHYVLHYVIALHPCLLHCIPAMPPIMHQCNMSNDALLHCVLYYVIALHSLTRSLHCIHARNNRVLGHCRGKVSRIPGFQAVETSCLKIFIIICLLLSPSDPIDRSYSLPAYAGSFGVVNTSSGDILLESHFRTLLT